MTHGLLLGCRQTHPPCALRGRAEPPSQLLLTPPCRPLRRKRILTCSGRSVRRDFVGRAATVSVWRAFSSSPLRRKLLYVPLPRSSVKPVPLPQYKRQLDPCTQRAAKRPKGHPRRAHPRAGRPRCRQEECRGWDYSRPCTKSVPVTCRTTTTNKPDSGGGDTE